MLLSWVFTVNPTFPLTYPSRRQTLEGFTRGFLVSTPDPRGRFLSVGPRRPRGCRQRSVTRVFICGSRQFGDSAVLLCEVLVRAFGIAPPLVPRERTLHQPQNFWHKRSLREQGKYNTVSRPRIKSTRRSTVTVFTKRPKRKTLGGFDRR